MKVVALCAADVEEATRLKWEPRPEWEEVGRVVDYRLMCEEGASQAVPCVTCRVSNLCTCQSNGALMALEAGKDLVVPTRGKWH